MLFPVMLLPRDKPNNVNYSLLKLLIYRSQKISYLNSTYYKNNATIQISPFPDLDGW